MMLKIVHCAIVALAAIASCSCWVEADSSSLRSSSHQTQKTESRGLQVQEDDGDGEIMWTSCGTGGLYCHTRQLCDAAIDGMDAKCTCKEGWGGAACMEDINECLDEETCNFEGAVCVDHNPWDTLTPRFSCRCNENLGYTDGEVSEYHGVTSCRYSPPCGSSNVPLNDLGIRFNKVIFDSDPPDSASTILPLGPADYPICPETALLLRQSQCWSVTMESDCTRCTIPYLDLIESIGGHPTHPVKGPSPFWDELLEVVEIQKARLNGTPVESVLGRVPQAWSGASMEDVAEFVHNEYPGSNQAGLINQFIAQKVPLDRNVIPTMSKVEFLLYEVLLAEVNTWAIGTVGPHNFGLKFHAGRARPEEVVWLIYNANAVQLETWAVPERLVRAIKELTLEHPHDFTAYDEGSPTHPAWPAMHSAASVASFWLAVVMDLSTDQLCEAMALDYGVSFGRTIAGVHYPSDNFAGLMLGNEILARTLPAFLSERFGSDPSVVRDKIERVKRLFDWENFIWGPCVN